MSNLPPLNSLTGAAEVGAGAVELTQQQFMDLLARAQPSTTSSSSGAAASTGGLNLAALLSGGGGSSSSGGGGFAIGGKKETKTFEEAGGKEGVVGVTGEDGKVRSKGRMYCPRDGCGSLLLLEGVGEWVDMAQGEVHLPIESGSPFTSDPSSSPTTTSTWHVTGLPMCFENVGFTRTAGGQSGGGQAAAPAAGGVKYMICAECDLGPLGWCYEGGKEGWLGVGRVRY